MKFIKDFNDNFKSDLLDFLYENEIFHSSLIDIIENSPEQLGKLYAHYSNGILSAFIHYRWDGNSNFTTFDYKSKTDAVLIANHLKDLDLDRILIAGKYTQVKELFTLMNIERNIARDLFFKLNVDVYKNLKLIPSGNLRQAKYCKGDLDAICKFTIGFFGATTKSDIDSVCDESKLIEKINKGMYILEVDKNDVGMARFLGQTKHFTEITSAYIDPIYRKKGLGKALISHMINQSLAKDLLPILATDINNTPAINTYTKLGFEVYGEYSFEFLK
jgi:ribosomal protein S18 acetylase RimI-like enzyme